MAAKKKTKKKPKKAKKRVRIVGHKYPVGECQTRGTQCQKNPSLVRSTPKKKPT